MPLAALPLWQRLDRYFGVVTFAAMHAGALARGNCHRVEQPVRHVRFWTVAHGILLAEFIADFVESGGEVNLLRRSQKLSAGRIGQRLQYHFALSTDGI